jgi:hypothetical protein
MEKFESGMEKTGSGIRDKHPGSATLVLPSIHPYHRRKTDTERDKSQQSKVLFSSIVTVLPATTRDVAYRWNVMILGS